jgi:hypothetical protein
VNRTACVKSPSTGTSSNNAAAPAHNATLRREIWDDKLEVYPERGGRAGGAKDLWSSLRNPH